MKRFSSWFVYLPAFTIAVLGLLHHDSALFELAGFAWGVGETLSKTDAENRR